jgi:hypothetical protein
MVVATVTAPNERATSCIREIEATCEAGPAVLRKLAEVPLYV